MTMTDPIADMLTRIRNASRVSIRRVDIPASKLKRKISEVLLENNFIRSIDYVEDGLQGILRIRLRYTPDGISVIKGIKRISRPGLRIYKNKKDLIKGSKQPGMLVLSTSSGVMNEKEAIRRGISGEALFRIW
ncbi:MAG: 30S ribosomal protein S8 [candidate division Zixibacteria bacterium 4484_95]|nr:MAG: 30S ribosomal protein S8 [candidate division Zixibacteria bacterium 4484_95]RKX17994.1 MAG: 30S ribosomal protein S8 [candidate division Zixibacteria bacterium]